MRSLGCPPGEDHEAHELPELLPVLPGVQRAEVVLSDEIKNLGPRMPLAHEPHGIDRKRNPLAADLAVVPCEARLALDGRRKHLATARSGRRRPPQLVRRDPGRNKYHAVEAKFFQRLAGENEVPVVDGVEAPAVKTDLAQ